MRYKVIENNSELENVKRNVKRLILYIIPETFNVHPVHQNISLVFLYDLETFEKYVIPVNHSDFSSELTIGAIASLLEDKEVVSIDSKKDYHITGVFPSIDINILSYISTLEILDLSSTHSNQHSNFYQSYYRNLSCVNCFVPSGYFMELFDTIVEFCESILTEFSDNLGSFPYKGSFELNKILGMIESSGLQVDPTVFKECFDERLHSNIVGNKVFSEYSFFTSTGRPSNKFGGINFAALSKKDDTRKSFVSRFREHGLLVDMDFQACHPHLIAKLIGYTVPENMNIYEYLGKFYFNKTDLSVEEVEKSKTLTFRQLYGHVDKEFRGIPYFRKKIDYNQKMVEFFRKHGYIETPIFKRKLDSKNFGEENAEKMFAYLLQSYETEVNLIKAKKVLEVLQNYKSKIVLYTYDSFLIDFCKDDPKSLILEIKKLLEGDGMPISLKVGTDYKTLKKITL